MLYSIGNWIYDNYKQRLLDFSGSELMCIAKPKGKKSMYAECSQYRERIYGAYVTGRSEALAPRALQGLASRLPYLRWLAST